MKGVILAGGLGTRLAPLTRVTNKHLLPVYNKPMIYYPIECLINAGIEEIMIVTGGNDAGDFLRLLGNGNAFGLRDLHYTYQEGEGGIADALRLAENFAEGGRIAVVLGDNIIETIINKSDKVKELKNTAKDKDLTAKEKKELTDEEKEYKSKRKLVQEKLIKFATRIPAFMYLTDFRENTLQDVITKLEPELFLAVTGLSVNDFHLLVRLKVFNTEQMNQAVFAFRRYEDASLRYTGIDSHEGLTHYGLYDTVVAIQ